MNPTRIGLVVALLALVAWTTPALSMDVRPGETVRGEVAGAGAVEILDLDLAAGDAVSLKIAASAGTGCAPALTVLDPDGAVVASAANERKAKIRFVAEASGTYALRLASDHATSARFTLKIGGDQSRTYSDKDGALDFGARAGSRVDIKVKARDDAQMNLRDAHGALLAHAEGGRKLRETVASVDATADYALDYAPDGARARLKVSYPAPRGSLEIVLDAPEGPAGSYSPPVADADEDEDEADEPEDDGSESTDDGGDAIAGDGTTGGNGDVVGAPAVLADHAYLTDLLEPRFDAEIERLRIDLGRLADRPVNEVFGALEAAVSDPIVTSIRDAVADRWDETAGAELARAMVDVIAARRRADRARRAADLLAQQIPQTTLAGDGAYDAGQAMLAAGIAGLDSAIDSALAAGLRHEVTVVDGAGDPEDGTDAAPADWSFDAPPAAPASVEVIAGHAAMDAAALGNAILARARLEEPAAIEVAEVLYAGYEDRLVRNMAADANAPATLEAIRQARMELETLRRRVFGIEFEIALLADPRPARDEAYEMTIAILGADSDVEFEVEGAEANRIESAGGLCVIEMPGASEPYDLVVRARHEGEERAIAIHVEPGQDEEPASAELVGRIVDEAGMAVEATYELRTVSGEQAYDLDGRPVAGATDANGFFAASRVPAGEYEMTIHAPGYEAASVPVVIADEDPADLGEIVIR